MKRIISLFLTLILCTSLAAGCKPSKKPVPTPKPAPNRMTPAPARKPAPNRMTPAPGVMPTSSKELNKLSVKLAGEAAKVKGVKKATVVLSKRTAYVGIDLQSNIEAAKTKSIKKEVADKVKKSDKRLDRVYVSSDADLVTRIKKVGKGIEQGKPISSFTREIEEIGRRIAP